MKRHCTSLLAASILLVASAARADWNPGDPAKWVQLPDLTSTGMDVYDTASPAGATSKILADDWLCTSTDPVTDVHIWGSWLNNVLPVSAAGGPDPSAVLFKLSIHADVPATSATPSHPGQELWSTVTAASATRLYATAPEQFYDPNTNQIIGTDTNVYQYNFFNLQDSTGRQFVQLGTAANPIVYWLDVQALPADPNAIFGWKTAAPPHNLDDAVFGDTVAFDGPLLPGGIAGSGWTDMHYPNGPFAQQSFDLAFVITTPEPGTLSLLTIGVLTLLHRRRKSR